MLLWLLVALCAVAVLFVFLALPGESGAAQRAPFWGRNHAHRGLHTADKTIPENSLPAFTAAVDAGYGIELDIQLSKDGEVMVFHDDTLSRVCGVPGRLDAFTLDELRAMRLCGTAHGIPTLREVLALVDGRAPLIIELKTGPRNTELCESAWRILRQYDGDICVESFDPRIVRWFKKNVPGLLRGQLAATPKALGKGLSGVLIGTGLSHFLGRPHFVAYQLGKKPFTMRLAEHFAMRVCWTARTLEAGERAEEENEAVIFEFYHPAPRFASPPAEPGSLPDVEDEYRF